MKQLRTRMHGERVAGLAMLANQCDVRRVNLQHVKERPAGDVWLLRTDLRGLYLVVASMHCIGVNVDRGHFHDPACQFALPMTEPVILGR
jgi:hypothetical protein